MSNQFQHNIPSITDFNGRIWLMVLSFPIVVAIAWVFYLVVERPSIILSKKIKYKDSVVSS